MISCRDTSSLRRIQAAEQVWWFLDYDGTLADFAPNPEVVLPEPELISLVKQLAAQDDMRVTIISGRRLAQIEQLLPINGIIKAGSYGLELRLATGELRHAVAQEDVRATLDPLKLQWEQLLSGRAGFFLEDKGWALAVHAKDAESDEGVWAIEQARLLAERTLAATGDGAMRISAGDRFLEAVPQIAGKQRTVEALLEEFAWPGALPVYVGDDDKDAPAFCTVREWGGIAVAVGNRPAVKGADCRLETPADCRAWLHDCLLRK